MFKNTRTITEISILIALAYVLEIAANTYSTWIWAYGGALSISLVPLAIIGYRHGWKAGFVGGFIMGLLQLLMGAWIVHPAQVLLDFPLPFALLGLTGLWRKQVNRHKGWRPYIILSTFIASLLRLACHVLAGYIFWSEGLTGTVAFWNSFIYNFPYVLGSWILSALILCAIYKRFQPMNYQLRRR